MWRGGIVQAIEGVHVSPRRQRLVRGVDQAQWGSVRLPGALRQ